MSATAISVDAQRLPTPALRRFAWGVVVYFIIVFLGGTLVRATGAGAGCGDHWPLCNGTVVQHHPRVDTIIEFTHRIMSGFSLFAAVGLLAWTLAGTVRGHLARKGGQRVGGVPSGVPPALDRFEREADCVAMGWVAPGS